MAHPHEPAPPGHQAESAASPPEDKELEQYIHSFTVSSDRVRHIVVVAAVASVMAFAAQWNSSARLTWWDFRLAEARIAVRNKLWNDAEGRLATCCASGPQAAGFRDECERVAQTWDWLKKTTHGKASLEAHLAELEKARVNEILMVSVPFVGIRFDINDLVAFSAIGLGIIYMMLVFAMARQHENLFLSLWKVRRLAETEKRYDDGESRANFLYHALAMAQVFTRPPTLAREHPRGQGVAAPVLFLLPALIQLHIVYEAWRTRAVGMRLNAVGTTVSLRVASAASVLIVVGALACWQLSRAGNARWRETFFGINPALRRSTGSPQVEWLKLAELPRWQFTTDGSAIYFAEPLEYLRPGETHSRVVWKIPVSGGLVEQVRDLSSVPDKHAALRLTDGSKYVFRQATTRRNTCVLTLEGPGGSVQPVPGRFSRHIGPSTRDDGGVVYVIDGPRVCRVEGSTATTLGSDRDPLAEVPRNQWPKLLGLAIEGGHLLVADYDCNQVRRIGIDDGVHGTPLKSDWSWSPAGVVVIDRSTYVLEHRRLSVVGAALGKVLPLARVVRISSDPAGKPLVQPLLWRSPSSRTVLARHRWQALRWGITPRKVTIPERLKPNAAAG